MVASAYIKDGNIHLYNEDRRFSTIGGLVYELGKPLLDFVWYEPERFIDSFNIIAEAYNNEFAHVVVKEPTFITGMNEIMSEAQQKEIYVFFYQQMLMDFIYTFIESPDEAVRQLSQNIPNAEEKISFSLLNYKWSPNPDKQKRLFRAVKEVIAIMYEHLCGFQKFIIHEIEVLLHYRKEIKVPDGRSIDYIDILDEYHKIQFQEDYYYYLEHPFRTFYGRTATKEVEQLYGINNIEDLFRFEFIKMIENEIFIKKCKNCERFFIPKRRVDAEYCDRIWGDTNRRCNEIGATIRYEKRVAENPILEAHKKAYRRFNSRTRTKKMTQSEFMSWSDEAVRKRDECLAGRLSFDEFVAWLEQGRIRKSKSEAKNYREVRND